MLCTTAVFFPVIFFLAVFRFPVDRDYSASLEFPFADWGDVGSAGVDVFVFRHDWVGNSQAYSVSILGGAWVYFGWVFGFRGQDWQLTKSPDGAAAHLSVNCRSPGRPSTHARSGPSNEHEACTEGVEVFTFLHALLD